MPDQKPPRLSGAEFETLRALLQYQRDSLVRKVEGVDEAAARLSPVPSGTSLLWLVKHMARAEALWALVRFAGREIEIPDDTALPGDILEAAIEAYKAGWQRVDAVFSQTSDLDAPCAFSEADPPVNLRWVLMHLLEETARHAGHADILRELIDGRTGR